MSERDTIGRGTGPDEGEYTDVQLPGRERDHGSSDLPGEYVDRENADGTESRPRADEAGAYTDVELPSGKEDREDLENPGEYTDRDR
jgi:hypothetical protein